MGERKALSPILRNLDRIYDKFGIGSQGMVINAVAHELMHLEDGFWKTVVLSEKDHLKRIYGGAEEIRIEYNRQK
jgi:hypothetical protein